VVAQNGSEPGPSGKPVFRRRAPAVIGPDQAGGGYVGPFILAVGLTALLRILLGAGSVKKAMSGLLARLGMVRMSSLTWM
jgi:hypothetical protein